MICNFRSMLRSANGFSPNFC